MYSADYGSHVLLFVYDDTGMLWQKSLHSKENMKRLVLFCPTKQWMPMNILELISYMLRYRRAKSFGNSNSLPIFDDLQQIYDKHVLLEAQEHAIKDINYGNSINVSMLLKLTFDFEDTEYIHGIWFQGEWKLKQELETTFV